MEIIKQTRVLKVPVTYLLSHEKFKLASIEKLLDIYTYLDEDSGYKNEINKNAIDRRDMFHLYSKQVQYYHGFNYILGLHAS